MKKKSSTKAKPGAKKRAYKKRVPKEQPEKTTRSKRKSVQDDAESISTPVDKASLDFQIKHYNSSKAMNYDLLVMYRPRLSSPHYVIKLGKYFAENGLTFKSMAVGTGMLDKKTRLVAVFDDRSAHTEKDRVPLSDGPRYQFIRDRGLAEKIITALGIKPPARGDEGIKVYCDMEPVPGAKGDKMYSIQFNRREDYPNE